jgi:transposase
MQLGDARKLDQKTQEALRHRAVLLVENGATHMKAALAVGVHRGTVSRWCGTYRRDGASGLEKGKRGRRAGDRLMLTAAEVRRVQRWIRDKTPNQMKLPFALWTAQAVRELIHKRLGKMLGLSTMPLYLKRWGFTAQKPLTRATPRDPQGIAAWRSQDYPRIAAKREKAVIHWCGGVRDQDQTGRGVAPEGQAPVLTQARQKFSMNILRQKLRSGSGMAGAPRRRDRDFHSSGRSASRRSTTSRPPRPAMTLSPPPRRSSDRSRGARIGSSHPSTQNTCATPLEWSSVCSKYY